MKIVIDKKSKIVKYGFEDSVDVVISEKFITAGDLKIHDLNSENCELIEGVEGAPTKLYSNLYEWKDSTWKLRWDVLKKIEESKKKCTDLLSEVPTGTEESWTMYTEKLQQIKGGLLETVNPLSINWPKKP
jgi:hypothetical protein